MKTTLFAALMLNPLLCFAAETLKCDFDGDDFAQQKYTGTVEIHFMSENSANVFPQVFKVNSDGTLEKNARGSTNYPNCSVEDFSNTTLFEGAFNITCDTSATIDLIMVNDQVEGVMANYWAGLSGILKNCERI